MSQPPEPPDWQQTPQPAPPKPENKRFGFLALGLAVLMSLVVGSLLGAVGYSSSRSTATVAEPAPTVTITETWAPGEGEGTEAAEAPAEEETPSYTPKNSHWELTVKVLDKTCYGAGEGCDVEYRVQPKYVGPAPKPIGFIEITYEVTGDKEGPQTGTVQLEDGQYDASMTEEYAETRSRSTKLTAQVTDIQTFG
jgi:hypothetical protein